MPRKRRIFGAADPRLLEAIDQFAKTREPPVTRASVVTRAVEDYLARQGVKLPLGRSPKVKSAGR